MREQDVLTVSPSRRHGKHDPTARPSSAPASPDGPTVLDERVAQQRLFPEGNYTFRGRTIEGQRLQSTFALTHRVPDGPTIVSPAADVTVAPDDLVVEWLPVTAPAGVKVVSYQVLVVADSPGIGNPKRVFDVMLPGTANRLPIPAEFLAPGSYKGEVLAIEQSGNQTLSEVAFTVK